MTSPSDQEYLAALARGDREALAPLMERHHRRIYRLALAYLREPEEALEVVQETFVKAFRHADRWSPAAEPGRWLSRIAVNTAIDRYRRRRRRPEEPMTDAPDRDLRWVAPDGSPEDELLDKERRQRLDGALLGLPERQRAVLVLRHYEDMSLEEIGDALGMRLGTVKSTLHRAIDRLRRRLPQGAL
jgi:RNA polymerase sigma-70 factor (ECF subfamily)